MILDIISVTILFFGIVIVLKAVYDFRGAINSTPSIYGHNLRRKFYAASFNDILIGLIYFIIGMLLFVRIVSVEIALGLLVGISIIDKAKNYMKK